MRAAAALIEKQGFAATTTRQIAEAAGLEQGSLFHHFARKIDILSALLTANLQPALDYVEWLDSIELPAAEKLYLLCYRDTITFCSGSHNPVAILSSPEARSPEFDGFWEEENQLRSAYRRYIGLVEGGGAPGELLPDLAAEFVYAMIESATKWFPGSRLTAPQAAAAVGAAALHLVLPERSSVPVVVERASMHLDGAPFSIGG